MRAVPWGLGRCTGLASARHPHAKRGLRFPHQSSGLVLRYDALADSALIYTDIYKKEGVLKPSTFAYILVGFLVFSVWSHFSNNEGSSGQGETQTQDDGRDIKRSEQASMGTYSERDVCKAAISSMFFHSPSIMSVSKAGDEVYKVSYRRPSDNTLWENKCQIDGNRVHWGVFDGRWRTHEMDGVILFMALGNDLTIQENHNDGSTSVTRFTKQGDGSIVEVDA